MWFLCGILNMIFVYTCVFRKKGFVMSGSMIALIILTAVVFIAIWAIAAYNLMVHSHALVKEGWSGVDVQLKRRFDLIPNLVETVKGYSVHEKDLFQNIAKYRSMASGSHSIEERAQAEAGLTQTLKTLFAVVESYPELKANENFLSLQKELSAIEQDLNLARRYYNGTVRQYNVSIRVFPRSLIASMAGFTSEPYFELSSEAERNAPKVQF